MTATPPPAAAPAGALPPEEAAALLTAINLIERVRHIAGERVIEVARDVLTLRAHIVNLHLVGPPRAGDRGWVLVDAGLPGHTDRILNLAAERFGRRARPAAVILTHGHYDHIGSLAGLVDYWQGTVPIYAHARELPFLTGLAAYPPADPTADPGLMARLGPLVPGGPFRFQAPVEALPGGEGPRGPVPGLSGWEWIATPGHAPGHVALWRGRDRLLIAGDAFVTQRQERLVDVITARPELSGPPRYYTIDWPRAAQSVRTLAALQPLTATTGHGWPVEGPSLGAALGVLAAGFEHLARPADGRYVETPVVPDEMGGYELPPKPADPVGWAAIAVAGTALAGSLWAAYRHHQRAALRRARAEAAAARAADRRAWERHEARTRRRARRPRWWPF